MMRFNACCCLAIITLMRNVYSGYPISNPNALTVQTQNYNLIDTNPSCFYEEICNMFPPGGEHSTFPNSEERFQHILYNMFRMNPNDAIQTQLGHWKYSPNTLGGITTYCQGSGCAVCGSNRSLAPLYWYSDANQMARFKQWDSYHCNQSWYSQPGQDTHSTCKWGKNVITTTYLSQQYKTGTNRCALFGTTPNPTSSPTNPAPFNDDCTFLGRRNNFCHDTKDRCWFDAETFCFGNNCVSDVSCSQIFGSGNQYVGIGYMETNNGASAVYSSLTTQIYYTLPSAAHYDERMRLIPSDYNNDGKYFVLTVEYFNWNMSITASECYALFDGQYTLMSVYIGTGNAVIFSANFLPPTLCKPYSFICKTSTNEYFRLPQDANYYFGTEWMNISAVNTNTLGLNCKENHYYYDNITESWIVNGGPSLTTNDIWYYQNTVDYGSCIGCQYISILDCYSLCILSDFAPFQCQCNSTTQNPTTQSPTTPSPTTQYPTTASPTMASLTTASPTMQYPTTASPTMASPTTAYPTTPSPTIPSPTTQYPTTQYPTPSPTMQSPTTPSPETPSPTTVSPTMQYPTVPQWEACIPETELFDVSASGAFRIDVDTFNKKMKIIIRGPRDKWFGIGFGQSFMQNTYAITITGESPSINATQRTLGHHSGGEIERNTFIELSFLEFGSMRVVGIVKNWKDENENIYDFTDFFECKIKSLPIIWSRGLDLNFSFHGDFKNNTLSLVSCFCQDTAADTTLNPVSTISAADAHCPIGCLLYSVDACNWCWCNSDGEFTACSNRQCNGTRIDGYCEECHQDEKECDDGSVVQRVLELYCEFPQCIGNHIDINSDDAMYYSIVCSKLILLMASFLCS